MSYKVISSEFGQGVTEDIDEDYLAEVIGSTQEEHLAGWIDEDIDQNDGYDSELDEYEDNAAEVDDWMPNTHRKQLTRQRLVNSLDSCLDIRNFDEYPLPTETKEYTAILEKPKRRTDDGKEITWIDKIPLSKESAHIENNPTTGGVVRSSKRG